MILIVLAGNYIVATNNPFVFSETGLGITEPSFKFEINAVESELFPTIYFR